MWPIDRLIGWLIDWLICDNYATSIVSNLTDVSVLTRFCLSVRLSACTDWRPVVERAMFSRSTAVNDVEEIAWLLGYVKHRGIHFAV